MSVVLFLYITVILNFLWVSILHYQEERKSTSDDSLIIIIMFRLWSLFHDTLTH